MIRLLIAAGLAFALSALGTRLLIDVLTRQKIGQPIREDGPQGHKTKAGTPTMGGLAIVAGATSGYVLSDLISGGVFTRSGLLAIATINAAAFVGFVDDWLKVTRERNLGLTKRTKMLGLVSVAVGFAVLADQLVPVEYTISFTRWDQPGIELGRFGWMVWAVFIILAMANAVNLTDGLDGLAAGSGIFSFAAYGLIAFWIFRQTDGPEGVTDTFYAVPHALDLAVVAMAMVAALAGFLWYNAPPADIFMGDTGSLAIGAGLASLSLLTNTQLLLVVIGGVYVLETISVMLQVSWFRATGGRRVFRMAPIHHHFELRGWRETKVIIRFWIIGGSLTAVGLGMFYADWVQNVEVAR